MPSGPAVVAVDARLPSERQAATDPEAGEAAVTLADVHALVDSLARSGAEPSALQQACLESARASPPAFDISRTCITESGSVLRRASSAIVFPSGDHRGLPSPSTPLVICVIPVPSALTRQMLPMRRSAFQSGSDRTNRI